MILFLALLFVATAIAGFCALLIFWPLALVHLRDRHPDVGAKLGENAFARPSALWWLLSGRYRSDVRDPAFTGLATPALGPEWSHLFAGWEAVLPDLEVVVTPWQAFAPKAPASPAPARKPAAKKAPAARPTAKRAGAAARKPVRKASAGKPVAKATKATKAVKKAPAKKPANKTPARKTAR